MNAFTYTLIRTNRRSIALILDCNGDLTVRSPRHMSKREIDAFVLSKQDWIFKKQQEILSREAYLPITAEDGSTMLYLGNSYKITKTNTGTVMLDGTQLLIPYSFITDDLIAWYKREALPIFRERVDYYANLMGVSYSALKLSGAKTRWGSCSAKDSLNLSWRLILCPPSVIDYVVVHELSHITHKDHSTLFWARVASILPDYKKERNWLKDNGKIMEII